MAGEELVLVTQEYVAFGEYRDVDDGDGGTIQVEDTYPQPRVVSELAPNQRGSLKA